MRNTKGMAVAPDKDLRVKGQKAVESEEEEGGNGAGKEFSKEIAGHDKMLKEHDEQIDRHHERISFIEKMMGIKSPEDGMKGQDQSGADKKMGEGHDTMKLGRAH